MSLLAWLPLNGNLNNQGAGNFSFTSTGSIMETGKIGQSYSFGESPEKLYSNLFTPTSNNFSLCCWYKNITDDNGYILGLSFGTGTTDGPYFILYKNASNFRLYLHGAYNSYSRGNLNLQDWHHYALTYDGNIMRLYIDGSEVKQYNSTYNFTLQECRIFIGCRSNHSATNGNATGYCGKSQYNDVRYYDHCLSAAEVHEISQGLVLHYKLDNNRHKNLISSNAAKTVTLGEGATNAYTSYWYLDTYVKEQEILKEGTPYTVIYDYSVNTLTSTSAYFYSQINTARCAPSQSATGIRTANTGTVKENFVMTAAQATYSSSFRFRIRFYGAAGDSVTISNLQICLGTYQECDYVSDCSGYGNNGICVNNIVASTDTPRYTSSTALVAGNSMINCGRGGMVTDSITVSLWCKYATWDTVISCTQAGGWNFESNQGLSFPVYISNGYKRATVSNLPSVNTWHMITGTYDRVGQTVSLYVDGELGASTAVNNPDPIKYHASNCIWLGAEATTSSTTAANGMIGFISDCRIYCTALSAADIKQLYEMSAKIDNKGNLHAFEFNEGNNGRELLAVPFTTAYNSKNTIRTDYDANGEITFIGKSSTGTNYLPINPSGHTYYYDIEVSTDASNVFYIGFERYDANKTSRSNNATIYLPGLNGTASSRSHKHYHGIVDLSTDTVNPTAFIALRILNDWSSPNSRVATVHKISLREVTTLQNSKITKRGQVITSEILELNDGTRVQKNGTIESNEFIEL